MGIRILLEAKDLAFSYGKRQVLNQVDLVVEKGEVVFLLGPNGSGKTTLLKLLLGFYKPSRGEIRLKGSRIHTIPRKALAKAIAYVPQTHKLSFGYSVLEIVLMGRTPHKPFLAPYSKKDVDLALECLERLSILHLKDRPYTRVSGGERKLVLIARALVQEASLLILDEPGDGLDFGNQVRLLEHLAKICLHGIACIITTHLIHHASWIGTRVLLLKEGRVLSTGSPKEALNEDHIKTLYGVDVEPCKLTNGRVLYLPRNLEKD